VISGLHHYALAVPDLAVAEGFLQDFGLETADKDGSLVATCPGRDQEQVRGAPPPESFLANHEPAS
jgi:catechol 2,3-dioxygenase-like lactoylglutathione lyase family enzyme